MLEDSFPDITTTERAVKNREGRIYLDYLQNVRGKTLIAPFGVRPRQGAPVSVPLSWDELEAGEIGPCSFNLSNILTRLNQIGDPWEKQEQAFSLERVLAAASTR